MGHAMRRCVSHVGDACRLIVSKSCGGCDEFSVG